MVNMLHLSKHVRHGFDNLKVATFMSKTARAPEDHQSVRMRNCRRYWIKTDQDPTQTQQQSATALNVSQETVDG